MSVAETTNTKRVKDVLEHHLKCFGEGDLKGILSDYAPAAVLFTPDGPFKGTDAMRPLFQALIAEFGKPGAVFSMKQQSVEGEYAYILWTAETADNVYEVGTDTFVVREGKIVTQSFTGKITPRARNRPLFLVGVPDPRGDHSPVPIVAARSATVSAVAAALPLGEWWDAVPAALPDAELANDMAYLEGAKRLTEQLNKLIESV